MRARSVASVEMAIQSKPQASLASGDSEYSRLLSLEKSRNRTQQEMQYLRARLQRLSRHIRDIDGRIAGFSPLC